MSGSLPDPAGAPPGQTRGEALGEAPGNVDHATSSLVQQLQAQRDAALQALARLQASQEEFLRSVSHDLRAPLRHITSYGALVREVLSDLPAATVQTEPVQEALQFLGTMDQSARRMGQMIDGLLALARFARTTVQPGAVALQEAMDQARQALAPLEALHREAGGEVRWDIAPDLPRVQADPVWLRELLVQLLGNALKFTRGRRPARITVRWHSVAPPASSAQVGGVSSTALVVWTIEDNGVGFDMARAAGLFGVFQRLHRETEFEGVGAGLALCRAIAEAHGAQIAAHGRPGEGCTLQLQWPAAHP